MYENFTERAKKVMALANQEAQRLKHEYVGTKHILLGLAKEGVGVACTILKNLEIPFSIRRIRREVQKMIKPVDPDVIATKGRLPQTPRAKKVIEYAIEEARSLNHTHVGTEHLLLGLLREEGGIAYQILINLGLNIDKAREETVKLLGTTKEIDKTASELGEIGEELQLEVLKDQALEKQLIEEKPVKCQDFPFGEGDVAKRITEFLADKQFVSQGISGQTGKIFIWYKDQ